MPTAVAATAYALLYSDWDSGFRLQGEVWVPTEEARNSVGTRYIHTVTEMIHKDDLKASVNLLAAFLEEVDVR